MILIPSNIDQKLIWGEVIGTIQRISLGFHLLPPPWINPLIIRRYDFDSHLVWHVIVSSWNRCIGNSGNSFHCWIDKTWPTDCLKTSMIFIFCIIS